MERGDLVQCVYPGSYPLTLGKFYEILGYEDDWITLKDDQGVPARYAGVRFEKAKTTDSPQRGGRAAA